MSTIYYTLESSYAVLAVYCNDCRRCCSFAYSWPHHDIAFWTINKEKILCPACAKNDPTKVYRKVMRERDIPLHRSKFRTESSSDQRMFGSDEENKKSFSYRFCSEREEEDELSGRVPMKKIDCDCGKC